MIRVSYNITTTLVIGYYLDSIKYGSIPVPFIEITEEEHKNALDKVMCVKNGIYQEYVKTNTQLLREAKSIKAQEIKIATQTALYQHIIYNGHDFIVSEKAASNILGAIILNQPSYDWRDTDSNLIIITVADLRNLAGLIAQQRGSVYNNEAIKLIELKAANTITKVNNIIW
jgi:hypothetical protein